MGKSKLSEKDFDELKNIIEKYGSEVIESPISDKVIEKVWNGLISSNDYIRSGTALHPFDKAFAILNKTFTDRSKFERAIFDGWFKHFNLHSKKKEFKLSSDKMTIDSNKDVTSKDPASVSSDKISTPFPIAETSAAEPLATEKAEEIDVAESPVTISEDEIVEIEEQPHGVEFTETSILPPSVRVPDILTPPADVAVPYNLKNGKVGQEYLYKIDFKKIYNGSEISDYTIEGLESIGLTLNKETGEITGTPTKAGDPKDNFEYELTVRYQIAEGNKESIKIFIKILPDPKSMWKILEPPDELGDRKAHTDHRLLKLGKDNKGKENILMAASKRGRSHAHKALFRDDHVEIEYLDDIGWSIIAVADGAGSAKLSRVGSKVACETAIEHITNTIKTHNNELEDNIKAIVNNNDSDSKDKKLKPLLYEILAGAAFHSAKALQEEAKLREVAIREFSTTLLLAIHNNFDFGNFFSGFWVGDGALAIYNKEEKTVKLLGIPDGGEFSGETAFITMNTMMTPEELMKRIHYTVTDDFTAFIAMTDGVSDPKFRTESDLAKVAFWDDLWMELKNDVIRPKNDIDIKLLEWLDFWAEGEHDDRTIAILF